MKFLGFEVLSPEENMKRDEELLFSLEEGKIEPCFRIYEWSELCISIGKNQEMKKFPIKVVRRPTGGGALIHGWDISFCIVDYKRKQNLWKIYKRISENFVKIFEYFRIKLEFEKNKSYKLDTYYCFFFPTFGELKTKSGKKIVSMAMRELKETFLLHGSIYITFDYKRAESILGIDECELKRRITSLRELGIEKKDFIQQLYSSLSSFILTRDSRNTKL